MIDSIISLFRLIVALILILFLPGFLIVNALFPYKKIFDSEYDILYRIGIGIGISICVSMMTGLILGKMMSFSADTIFLILLLLSLFFFAVGLLRGAYPRIYRKADIEVDYLERRLNDLLKKAEYYRARMKNMPKSVKNLYRDEYNRIMMEIEIIEEELKKREKNEDGHRAKKRSKH